MKIDTHILTYFFLTAVLVSIFNERAMAEFDEEKYVISLPDGNQKEYFLNFPKQNKEGISYTPQINFITKKDSILHTLVNDHNALKSYIVVFDQEPVRTIRYYKNRKIKDAEKLINFQVNEFEKTRNMFFNDIEILKMKNDIIDPYIYMPADIEIHRFWRVALAGCHITTREWMAKEIEKLPYIRLVEEEKEFTIVDDESNDLIEADRVWSELEATGDGILISIIDTGIDYDHTELDDGKVIDGYDFVNDDADPWDDHGHGTHCAGIAAANGENLQGVAPDAELLAVKVLNSGGSGYSNWIISGINYSIDPDGDPLTDDGADVISMSLGGPGNPDDAQSEAIDNAVDNGVFAAVAAGNSGSSNYTIGSPGCARKATTVGASSKSDIIASFSSRGPTSINFGIKPEVLAPGVSIYSSLPGNNYISWDGTSMATPHVAGAAALLLELDSDLQPEEIKAAFVHTAVDIGENVWTQGNGRIDIFEAASVQSYFIPQTISFGVVDLAQDVWTKTETVTLKNNGDVDKTYTISVEGDLPDGLTFSVNPESVDIDAGDEAELSIEISCDNDLVPIPSESVPTYEAKLVATSDIDEIKSPMSVIKSPMMSFTFETAPYFVFVHNNEDYYTMAYNPGTSVSMLLPEDAYDIIIKYYNSDVIVYENVTLSNTIEYNITDEDVLHTVNFVMYNTSGNSLYFYRGVTQFSSKVSGYGTSTTGGHPITMHCSDISDNYFYEAVPYYYAYNSTSDLYMTPWAITDGIGGDMTISNDYNEYKQINYSYDLADDVSQIFYQNWISMGWGVSFANYSTDVSSQNRISSPNERKVFVTPIPYSDFIFKYFFEKIYDTSGDTNPMTSNMLYNGAYLRYLLNDPLRAYTFDWENDVYSTSESTIDLQVGKYAPMWTGAMNNLSNQLKFAGSPYYSFRYYTDQFGSVRKNTVTSYSIFEGGSEPTQTGTFENREIYQNWDILYVLSGEYQAELSYDNYSINGTQGLATARVEFDLASYDNDTPFLESFQILSDGIPADLLSSIATNTVIFEPNDLVGVDNVELYYKGFNGDTWESITLSSNNDIYTGSIPSSLASGLYSLKIYITDINSNPLTVTLSPAFEIFTPLDPPNLVSPSDQETIAQNSTVLSWSEVSDYSYDILVSDDMYFSNIIANINDISETSYTLYSLQNDHVYYWKVRSDNGDEFSEWSSSWSFIVNYNECPSDLEPSIIQIESQESRFFKAINNIVVPGQRSDYFLVSGNGSTGGTASFVASSSVKLTPGFHAQQGSSVRAYIHNSPCSQGDPKIIIANESVGGNLNSDLSPLDCSIFPNPNQGIFTLSINNKNTEADIEITDLMGRHIYSVRNVTARDQVIDLSAFSRGVYYVKIISNTETVFKKLIKQ